MTAVLFAILLQDDPSKLIGEYAELDLDSKARAERSEVVFDDASRKRILLEHRIVACGRPALKPLVEALKHESRHVRAMAAELLGVLGDKTVATALAAAAKDSDPTVRVYAIQSLAWLHAGTDAIDAGLKDSNRNVQFIAQRAREQLKETTRVRDAYAALGETDLSGVEIGKKTPDFTLPAADGKAWRLSSQKGVVILMFQLADW